jgi:[acyl-carrier-protein] S-malonyltransferase
VSGRLLLLCPGQGGQHAGMFDLAQEIPAARDWIARHPMPADSDRLFENSVAQPAVVTATLGMWMALRDTLPAPALVAGYSIGELSAYCVAGSLAPDDTVRLASARAALMDAAAAGTPQGLAAVRGVPVDAVRAVIDIAIVTGHDTCIAGGTRTQLDALPAQLPAARIQLLPVGVASHTSLMSTAAAPFAALLESAPFAAPRIPVLAGTDGGRVMRRDVAIARLMRQVSTTIAWDACMDAASEAGIMVALELGPGAALARMLQSRHPHINCRSAGEFHSLDGIARWADRAMAGTGY